MNELVLVYSTKGLKQAELRLAFGVYKHCQKQQTILLTAVSPVSSFLRRKTRQFVHTPGRNNVLTVTHAQNAMLWR